MEQKRINHLLHSQWGIFFGSCLIVSVCNSGCAQSNKWGISWQNHREKKWWEREKGGRGGWNCILECQISLKLLSSPAAPFEHQSSISICLTDTSYKIVTWKRENVCLSVYASTMCVCVCVSLRWWCAMMCFHSSLSMFQQSKHSSSIKVACCLLWSPLVLLLFLHQPPAL